MKKTSVTPQANQMIETKTPLRPKINPGSIQVKHEPTVEEKALQAKLDEVGKKGFLGDLEKKDKTTWYYKGGCLCYNSLSKKAFEIHGDIYKKWKSLGGTKWGVPETDELTCPDKVGRYNHFNKNTASIYWSPSTGAQGIWGDIRKKWAALGYERSYLGYPVTDEVDFPEKGKANGFQGGDIYWWSDTGAIDLKGVALNYKGIYCFKETSWDQSSNSDEPYVIMGVSSPSATKTYRSKIYDDVDDKESRPDSLEIYRGKPYGINIGTILMEHDFGDVEKNRQEIEKWMKGAHKVGMSGLGYVPLIGPAIAALAGPVLEKLMPELGKAVFDMFNFGDDRIGSVKNIFSAKQMIILALQTNKKFKNISYKFETSLIKGGGASYQVFYGIEKL